MAQSVSQESHYLSRFAEFEQNGASASPAWLRDVRRQAIEDFERTGFPTARRGNELWKYTDIRPLANAAFDLAKGPFEHVGTDVDFTPYDLPCPRVHQLVFVDGHYAADLSTEPASEAGIQAETIGRRSEGLIVGRLSEAIQERLPLVEEHLSRSAAATNDAFTALNTAFVDDGALVYIPDGVAVHEPIYLLFLTTGVGLQTVSFPRVLIVAGPDSRATILQGYETLGGGQVDTSVPVHFTDAVTEVVMRRGATLRLYKMQRESLSAYHVAATRATLERDASLTSVTIDLGGGLVRHDQTVTLAEGGATTRLNGLYLGDGSRHIDNHTVIDHAAPDTASDEVFKGILNDASHGVFVGQVLVRRDSQRVVAHQVNKNLVLSDDAEVDTQPKLEILADDVQCTHGAAIGRLDPNSLFYLNARGLGEREARELLVHGFVNEVIRTIEDDAIRQYTDDAVLARLG